MAEEQSARAASAAEGDDLVGRLLFGEYEVERLIGAGAMGAVYLARQRAIDQPIAIKVLNARAAQSDEIVQRFHREARVISMVTHPNIVRVLIFGRTDDGRLCMALEYVEGRELRDVLQEAGGGLDELRAIKIMKQSCSAVAEAHDFHIIHRDLKPENFLLTEFRGEPDFVKILDFGIAKIKGPAGDDEPQLTQAGIVYGTPFYISPEQAQALELDGRTDIYSLGCILYEMLVGRPPFTGDDVRKIVAAQVYDDPAPLAEVAPHVDSPTMQSILDRALAKERDDRFADALEMYEALEEREIELLRAGADARRTYFPGSEITTGRLGAVRHTGGAGAGASPADAPTVVPAGDAAERSGRMVIALAGAVVFLGLLVLALLAYILFS